MFTVAANTSYDESQHALRPRCVHTITDRYSVSNTYLINEDRLFVVDPASEMSIHLLTNYIQNFLHRSPADIDLIVLTNLHSDHTRGIQDASRTCAD